MHTIHADSLSAGSGCVCKQEDVPNKVATVYILYAGRKGVKCFSPTLYFPDYQNYIVMTHKLPYTV